LSDHIKLIYRGIFYAVGYTALMTGESMNLMHWPNNNEGTKLKYSEKTIPQCHFIHHKSHVESANAGSLPPEPQQSLYSLIQGMGGTFISFFQSSFEKFATLESFI
jgi:hypothetical protein